MAFELIVLSPPEQMAGELLLLPELMANGLTTFHLRKPGWSAEQLTAYLEAIPERCHDRIVLHSHYELALRYPLKGIHLTEKSRQASDTAFLLPKLRGKSISASFHTLADVARYRRRYAYVFLSPIFDSVSKADYPSGFRLSDVQQAMRRWQMRGGYVPQVIALGGIAAANLPQVQEAGFAGAAVLGGIWQHPDPVAAFREMQSKIR